MTFKMTYYLTGNDLKCHLNLSDVHVTGPKARFFYQFDYEISNRIRYCVNP